VKAGDAFGNLWRGNLAYYHRDIARLGKAVDKHEWSMTPQTVNAVNLPLQNALNFPAAILQPGFFDPEAPAARTMAPSARSSATRSAIPSTPPARHSIPKAAPATVETGGL